MTNFRNVDENWISFSYTERNGEKWHDLRAKTKNFREDEEGKLDHVGRLKE